MMSKLQTAGGGCRKRREDHQCSAGRASSGGGPATAAARKRYGGFGRDARRVPPISASDLFANADRDRIGGKLDLAQQEFSDYLRWYGETPQAHMAQYLIASIYYSQNNYEAAVKEFDSLIQNFPASSKIPDAMYYKGQSLVELGRGPEATETIRELKRRYPEQRFFEEAVVSPPRLSFFACMFRFGHCCLISYLVHAGLHRSDRPRNHQYALHRI